MKRIAAICAVCLLSMFFITTNSLACTVDKCGNVTPCEEK